MPLFQQFVVVACSQFFLQVLYTVFGHVVSKQWFLDVWKREIGTESSQHYSNVFLEDFGQATLFAREVLDCIRFLRFFKIFGVIFSCICACVVSIKTLQFFFFCFEFCLYV